MLTESHPLQLPMLARLLRLRIDSRPEALADARRQVHAALARTRLEKNALLEMDIAVGEVLANTHVHAYYSGVGPVFVEVFQVRWTVTVIVIDAGDASRPPVVPPTLIGHTRRGGRGLYLASQLADDVEFAVNRVGYGLAVRLTKWFEDGRVHLARSDRGHTDSRHTRQREPFNVPPMWA
jgi:anti-sigma regulatory factor (Ser/Thr protein kinase)